ncbi:MAG: hypothetical protein AAF789_07890 [Bacteroidota bacterium]
MKRLTNLLSALVFASLVIFMSCGGDDSPSVDPLADEIANLTISQGFVTQKSNVFTNGEIPDGEWDGFKVTFTGTIEAKGGSFNTTVASVGANADDYIDVWPVSGNWTLSEDGTMIMRSDGINMSATISDSQLIVTFNVPDPSARTSGIAGNWSFTFTPDNS